MKVAAITITYNRLGLTKRTLESFEAKTSVDYHLFIDNCSTDGTLEYLKDRDVVSLDKNYGIAHAFREGVERLKGYDYILKLDNDIETVTEDIIDRMKDFYSKNNNFYSCSPVDLNLDPAFAPPSLGRIELNGHKCKMVTHTGGAFQMIPYNICEKLCKEYRHLKAGDYMIGKFYRRHSVKPIYLLDLEMAHIGINESTPSDEYIL